MKVTVYFILLISMLLSSCSSSKVLPSNATQTSTISASMVTNVGINLGYSIKSFAPVPNNAGWSLLLNGIQGIHLMTADSIKLLSKDILQAMDAGNFSFLDGSSFWMIAAILRGDNILRCYKWTEAMTLQPISAGDIPSSVDQVTDIQLFADSARLFAYVVGQRGQLEKWRLYDPGWGQVDGSVVANQSSPYPGHFIDIEGSSLCGSSLNKGIWCLDIEDGRTTPVRKRELSKDQVKAKLTVKGMTQLPDKTLIVSWSDGRLERISSDRMQTLGFIELMHGGEPVSGVEMHEWIAPGIWNAFPKGCLVSLSRLPSGAQIIFVDGAALMKE
jgi:hypothetical protein